MVAAAEPTLKGVSFKVHVGEFCGLTGACWASCWGQWLGRLTHVLLCWSTQERPVLASRRF